MIYIIGLGIEGKSSLSQRASALIKNASMLVGGKRHLTSFPEFKGKKVVIGSNLDEVMKVLTRHSQLTAHRSPVVLASGDPNFFGIADFMIKKIGKGAIEIIPNVSAMQYAFARIKENWNDARFLSLHGRSMDGIASEISRHNKIGIFTDPDNIPAKIAKLLLDNGIKDYCAYVCEDLGTDKEKITQGTLAQIAKKKFSPLNVMVLIKNNPPNPSFGKGGQGGFIFGFSDSSFNHSNGMITKEEIRVISLSKLKLKTDSIVWDIGAGSGSVSIEAAMLAHEGKVFAVEKQAARINHIEKNKKKFKAANLEIIHKNAPDGFKNLPAPDAVFVGGGGKDIGRILEACSKRIKNSGRIVVNAITLETLTTAARFFKNKRWDVETISVNIAKTKDAAVGAYGHTPLHIFNAYNPVFIIVGEKK